MLHGAAVGCRCRPQRRHRLGEARRAVDDDQLRRSQSAPDEIVEQRTPGRLAFLPMLLIASSISGQHGAHAERHEQRSRSPSSSRTRATVPSRISRMIGSSASERAFQASQSPFVLRQTRLTHVLADRPGKHSIFNAPHAAVLVPAR